MRGYKLNPKKRANTAHRECKRRGKGKALELPANRDQWGIFQAVKAEGPCVGRVSPALLIGRTTLQAGRVAHL
jgi:hypothetical protein